jgi:glycosyltransferase involved in cell wall biosynthesis
MTRARKIVYPIESLFPGGAEHALLRLASALDRSRFTPEVWLLRGGGELAAEFAAQGIAVRDCSQWDWNPQTPVVKATAFRSAMRLVGSRVQIVHSFAWDGCGTEAAAAMLAATPCYVARIATAIPRGNAEAWAFKLRLADRVIVLSEFSRRQIASLYPWVEAKLRVVPNGVECDRFAPDPAARGATRQALGMDAHNVVFVCVARLNLDKNHAFLLRAFQKLLATGKPARLLLLGTGGQAQRLVDLAAQLGIAQRVHFLGYRRDVPQILAASDAFVLASKATGEGGIEGMSNAALEAMSAGLPVVMTRNGSEEIVNPGQDGFVVDPRDDGELIAAMAALCDSAELRHTLGRAARLRVQHNYSLATTIAWNHEIYAELLERSLTRRLARIRRGLAQWATLGATHADVRRPASAVR